MKSRLIRSRLQNSDALFIHTIEDVPPRSPEMEWSHGKAPLAQDNYTPLYGYSTKTGQWFVRGTAAKVDERTVRVAVVKAFGQFTDFDGADIALAMDILKAMSAVVEVENRRLGHSSRRMSITRRSRLVLNE